MSTKTLTEAQKMGSISYDELMDSLTEDLDQNYELIKRYILYNQLNGSNPITFFHFISSGINEQKSILALKTLLKYGMNPNILDQTDIIELNYIMALIREGYSDKTIYEMINEGLSNGLNINFRTGFYIEDKVSLLDVYCGIISRTKVLNESAIQRTNKTTRDIVSFYKFLCKKGFLTSKIGFLTGKEEFKRNFAQNQEFIKIYEEEIRKMTENYREKHEKYKCPVNGIGIKALRRYSSSYDDFRYFVLWGPSRMLEIMSDDLEENYKIIKCIDEAVMTTDILRPEASFRLPITQLLISEKEKESLLVIKTFLKYGYHPNDCGIGIEYHNLTCNLLPRIDNANENFIFSIIKAGFSEKFIIEVIKESIKYGFDVNTVCDGMSLMHCLIFSKEYKGNISAIYRLLCANGFDSTLKSYKSHSDAINIPGVNILKAIEYARRKKGKIFDEADIKLFEEMYNEEILKVKKFLGIVKAEKDSLEPTERTSEKELPSIGKDYYDLLSNLSKQELEILSLKLKYKDEISSQDIAKLLSIDEKVVNDVLNKIKNLYIDKKEQKPITRAKTRSFQEK